MAVTLTLLHDHYSESLTDSELHSQDTFLIEVASVGAIAVGDPNNRLYKSVVLDRH